MDKLNSDQLRLFEAAEQRRRPGQMTPDQWMDAHKDDIAYHGTVRHDWEDAPTAHMGSRSAAEDRLDFIINHMSKNRSGVDDYFGTTSDDDGPIDLTAAMYMRRMAKEPHSLENMNVLSDKEDPIANVADAAHWESVGEGHMVPESVRQSTNNLYDGEIMSYDEEDTINNAIYNAEAALWGGQPVAYRNYSEGTGGFSYVVPRGSAKSWEQDVLEEKDAPETLRAYAKQRVDTGRAGMVPFKREVRGVGVPAQSTLDVKGVQYKPSLFEPLDRPHEVVNSYQFRTS
jgi:hypothetical protein